MRTLKLSLVSLVLFILPISSNATSNLSPELNWCSFIEERDDNSLIDRIFMIDPAFPPTQINDTLLWLARAASTNKVLMLDARYGDCLGCMNRHYNSYIGELREKNALIYGVIDFTDISGRQIDQSARRPSYSRIPIEPAYKFMQALTFGATQLYNSNMMVESYPLVAPENRDNEPNAIPEDQPNRVFTRAHFPNLIFIDGGQINKPTLNRMCFFASYGREQMSFMEDSQGISKIVQPNYAEMVDNLLAPDAVLMQLIGPNLYYSGTEASNDFAAPETEESISCILELHHWGIRNMQQCRKFVRAGFPY